MPEEQAENQQRRKHTVPNSRLHGHMREIESIFLIVGLARRKKGRIADEKWEITSTEEQAQEKDLRDNQENSDGQKRNLQGKELRVTRNRGKIGKMRHARTDVVRSPVAQRESCEKTDFLSQHNW